MVEGLFEKGVQAIKRGHRGSATRSSGRRGPREWNRLAADKAAIAGFVTQALLGEQAASRFW